jgi:ribonucleoside-diphosphate reductase alpha chain
MTEDLLKYFNHDTLAASVFLSKYAVEGESTPDDMHKRLAKQFAKIKNDLGDSDNLSDYGKTRDALTEESIYSLFKNFKYIVPQGSVMSILGSGKIGSLSNCFVVGQPYDSYGGIMRKDEELSQLMKRRGGVGIDISTLRPNNAAVTNAAGTSTGAVSFMERFSNTTREVAQNGRRGALMISIDVRHPDVLDFVKIKQDPTKVTGANVSVQLRDDFMNAVKMDADYFLQWPCETLINDMETYSDLPYGELNEIFPEVFLRRIKAKDLWDEIIKCAHNTAEPGLMFLDKHWDYSPDTVYPQYKGRTTNPCGEIFMQQYDACRLLAINLYSFVIDPFTENARFDFDLFFKTSYELQILADILIELELEHIDRILTKINCDPEPEDIKSVERKLWENIRQTAYNSRRTGSGFTALGDMLAALDLKYDGDDSLEFIEAVMRVKFEAELNASIDMAIVNGTFVGWDVNLEFEMDGEKPIAGKNAFYQHLLEEFPDLAAKMAKFGRRNVNWSTVAPTGTVSLMTQTTSGLEPIFMIMYKRRKKINPSDVNARIDFTDQNGDNWQEYPVLHPKFIDWYFWYCESSIIQFDSLAQCKDYLENQLSMEELDKIVSLSPWYKSTANDIDWVQRVRIQKVIQKYVTHSISSTINLPNNVSVDEVSEIYLKSWENNLKGVTVYRDGCRSGVLISNETPSNKNVFDYNDAVKRPKELPCTVDTVSIQKQKFTVLVGLLDGKPYEVFVVPSVVMKDYKTGFITKKSKGLYTLTCSMDEEIAIFKDLAASMSDEEEAITRLVSTSLRHGANVKFICEQLLKTKGGLNSFSKAIARVLKKHIPDGEISTMACDNCGSDEVVFEEGCQICKSCGTSKCG